MSFPTTPLLDDFNRANEDPLTGTWAVLYDTEAKPKIVSNAITHDTNVQRAAYWSASTFGPDCEVYVTFVTEGAASGTINSLFARIDPTVSPEFNSYRLRIANGISNGVRIQRVDTGTPVTLGADIDVTINDGDKVGLQCIGSAISAYVFQGGSWNLMGTRIDTTYSAAGYIGTELYGGATTPAIFDDFGGGTVVTATPPTVFSMNAIAARF